jgi:hypothetical protein
MHPLTSFSALLLAGSSGLVALTRSLARGSRKPSWTEFTDPKGNEVMAFGCLSNRLRAGKTVRCVVSTCPPSAHRGDTAMAQRFECDGVIVGLQPTRGRYGYQDVTVVVANPDFVFSRGTRLVVESIG